MAATPTVAVAYSGGRDSTALLHATLAAAQGTGLGVVALHVHHGLSAHADDWLAHCAARCAGWAAGGHAVAFDSRRLESRPARGESVEAWAREARYAALAAMARAHGSDLVLLGHHRRDQAETVLLQALRGAGAAGLAAMPRVAPRGGLTWARPWLGVAPQRIERYARAHALDWVDDDSNADARLRRNRLRHVVWPALEGAFPDAEAALAAVAARAAEALECAAELAAIDLPALDAGGGGLRIDAWLRLAPSRRGNALRAWLRREGGAPAPASLVARLLGELPAGDAPACWPAPGGRLLRRRRGVLRFEPAPPGEGRAAAVPDGSAPRPGAAPPAATEAGHGAQPEMNGAEGGGGGGGPAGTAASAVAATTGAPDAAVPPGVARFEGELRALAGGETGAAGAVRLPGWGGCLRWVPVGAGGLAADALGRLRIAARGGGERFQLGAGRPPRALKKQFQALGVPAWRRDGPLVWLGDALVHVPGLGHDARTLAPPGSPQVALSWAPDGQEEGARPPVARAGVSRPGAAAGAREGGERGEGGTAAVARGPAVSASRRRGQARGSR